MTMMGEVMSVRYVENPIYHIQHSTLIIRLNITLKAKALQEEEADLRKIQGKW